MKYGVGMLRIRDGFDVMRVPEDSYTLDYSDSEDGEDITDDGNKHLKSSSFIAYKNQVFLIECTWYKRCIKYFRKKVFQSFVNL